MFPNQWILISADKQILILTFKTIRNIHYEKHQAGLS